MVACIRKHSAFLELGFTLPSPPILLLYCSQRQNRSITKPEKRTGENLLYAFFPCSQVRIEGFVVGMGRHHQEFRHFPRIRRISCPDYLFRRCFSKILNILVYFGTAFWICFSRTTWTRNHCCPAESPEGHASCGFITTLFLLFLRGKEGAVTCSTIGGQRDLLRQRRRMGRRKTLDTWK